MKIILLEDVKSLGKKGEIVNVSDGYARNAILPKKLGVEATSKNLNDLKIKSGEGGRIFGSVSTKEIAQETKAQTGLDLDKKKMQLPEAIKALGTYEVPVKLHPKVTAKLTVQVVEG